MAKHRLFDANRREGWSFQMSRTSGMFFPIWRGRIRIHTGGLQAHLTRFLPVSES